MFITDSFFEKFEFFVKIILPICVLIGGHFLYINQVKREAKLHESERICSIYYSTGDFAWKRCVELEIRGVDTSKG